MKIVEKMKKVNMFKRLCSSVKRLTNLSSMNIEKKLERKPNGDDIWYLFIVIMTIVAMYCFYILKGQ